MLKIHIHPKRLFIAILILAIVYCSGSGLSNCIQLQGPVRIISIIMLTLYFLNRKKCKVTSDALKNYVPFWILFFAAFLSLVFNFSMRGISLWMYFFETIVFAALCTGLSDSKRILAVFVKGIKFFSVISLIGYFAFQLPGIKPNFLPVLAKSGDPSITYFTAGVYNIWIQEFSRNCGPFWEPSIFAAYLVLAMCINLVLDDEYRLGFGGMFLLVVTLLTTKSTGGYIMGIMAFGFYLVKNKQYNPVVYLIVLLILIMLPFFSDYIIYKLMQYDEVMFSKLFNFSESGTSLTRLFSMRINYHIFLDHPIFGIGLGEAGEAYLKYRRAYAPLGLAPAQTSTSMLFMAAFGIPGFYYTYAWMKSVFVQKLYPMQKILFCAIILFILNQTPHTNFLLSYIILFALLKPDYYTETGKGELYKDANEKEV